MLVSSPVSNELVAAMAATRQGTNLETQDLLTNHLLKTVSQSLGLAHAAENGFGCGHAIGRRFGRCHHGSTNETLLVTDASFYQTEAGLPCTFHMTNPSFLLKDNSHRILQHI